MTKKILFCLFLSIGSLYLHAQSGVLINLPPITNSLGQPIAGVTVSVFNASGTAGNLTCGAAQAIFSNVGLTTPINPLATNTITTDGFGNFPFYIATSGSPYGYTVSGQGTNSTVCYGFMAQLTAGSTPAFTSITAGTATITTLTAGTVNKVIYVDQQAGATADVKFANACSALPSGGGVLDARGFGPGNQSIAATVQCGSSTKPVAFLFDPSTAYQPSAAGTNMFQVSQNNAWRDLHIDTTNQATYSGNPISNASQGVSWWRMDNTVVTMASGSTGPCINFNSTSSSVFIDFGWVSGLQCTGGTAASGILLQNSGGGFVNSIGWSGIRIYNTKYGFDFEQAGTAAMTGHIVTDYFYEASSLATALAAVNMNATGHNGGNDLSGNIFKMQVWDLTGANKGVIVTAGSNGFACGNEFEGRLIAVTDNSTSCAIPNEFHDLSGNVPGVYQVPFLNVLSNLLVGPSANIDFSNTRSLRWKNTGGTPENILNLDGSNAVNVIGDPTAKKIFFFADGSTVSGQFNANTSTFSLGTGWNFTAPGNAQASQMLATQGSICTNGELALSAGWQSTGTATVTAVAGNGQTCSWTITTGTTTAANPTITDTLTNALPAATTVCEMNIHGGTHTAAAGEGFQQTTLSATAPVFTFNGTPTANGFTYFVTRRCGP